MDSPGAPVSGWHLAGLVVVVLAASVVTTVAGFGFSLVAVPLMASVVDPRQAVAIASILGILATGVLFVRLRGAVAWPIATRQLVAAAVGMPLGLQILLTVSETALRLAIAAAVTLGALGLAGGFRLRRGGFAADVGAGFISGVLNTSVGTAGPPLVLVNQARGLDPDSFRATLSAVFTGSAVVTNALFASSGRYTPPVLTAAAWCLPALAAGWFIGLRLHRHLDARRMRPLVLALLFGSAAVAFTTAVLT
jgi:uncharacterized membrane protein YfcA